MRQRGVKKVQIFVSDDLPGLEGAIKKIFPESDWQLCVLHMVRNTLNQVRKSDREGIAQTLKAIYRAETLSEAQEGLRKLRETWGRKYPKVVEKWEKKAQALLTFLKYPPELRRYLYTTNQLERLCKEVKRRTKVVEVFVHEGAVEKLLYLILSGINERLGARRLRGFAEIEVGGYRVDETH